MIEIMDEEHYYHLPVCQEPLTEKTQLIYKTIIYAPHPFTSKQMNQLLIKLWGVALSPPEFY